MFGPCATVPSECRTYRREVNRIAAALERCPFATRRQTQPESGQVGDFDCWCHATTPPMVCYGTVDECPRYMARRLAEYERLFRSRVGECGWCGGLFFVSHPWGVHKKWCSTKCKNGAHAREWRRRQGIKPMHLRRAADPVSQSTRWRRERRARLGIGKGKERKHERSAI